ncbi:MAG: MFS transporter, partial [Burkholderiales bacterium]
MNAGGIRALFLAYFTYVGLFSPYLSLYLAALGLSIAQIGVLMAVPQVLRIVGPPFWGWMADRGDSRVLLLRVSSAGACLAALL